MLDIERKMEIVTLLKKNKSASVTELSKFLFTSEATIRRDLEKLQSEGLVKRTHGGVVLIEGLSSEIPLYVREIEQEAAKDAIGRVAANMVTDGSIIIMDSSSTTHAMSKHLSNKTDLSILTNGAKTAITLGQMLHTNVFCTGGRLRENSLSYIGDSAKNFIANFHADFLFFSCRGVVIENGLFESSVEEAELRKVMLKCSRKKVLLCDSTKFDKYSFTRICDIGEIDYIISDANLDNSCINSIRQKGVNFIMVSGEK